MENINGKSVFLTSLTLIFFNFFFLKVCVDKNTDDLAVLFFLVSQQQILKLIG